MLEVSKFRPLTQFPYLSLPLPFLYALSVLTMAMDEDGKEKDAKNHAEQSRRFTPRETRRR